MQLRMLLIVSPVPLGGPLINPALQALASRLWRPQAAPWLATLERTPSQRRSLASAPGLRHLRPQYSRSLWGTQQLGVRACANHPVLNSDIKVFFHCQLHHLALGGSQVGHCPLTKHCLYRFANVTSVVVSASNHRGGMPPLAALLLP